METLGQSLFVWHKSQGFEESALAIVYQNEEDKFIRTVHRGNLKTEWHIANVISSHVALKV